MDELLVWLLASSAGLVVVAVLVALYEHLARTAEQERSAFASAPPRAVSIDVEIDVPDAPAALPPSASKHGDAQGDDGDAERRRAALDTALVRMAQPAAAAEPCSVWDVTAPMVGPGVRAQDEGSALAARREVPPHTHA